MKADDLFDISTTPTSLSPLVKGSPTIPMATHVDIHPLKTAEVSSRHDNTTTDATFLVSESYQQLCATFSQAMAHAGYVPLCRLLGQVRGERRTGQIILPSILMAHNIHMQST